MAPTARNLLAMTGFGAVVATVVTVGMTAPAEGGPLLPSAGAAPDSSSTATTTSGSAATTLQSDAGGYAGTEAYCPSGEVSVAHGRTARSMVVICSDSDGALQYRGVRISDGALLLATAKSLGGGSYKAVNEGVVYTVTPGELKVTSGGSVIYRDDWSEFVAPRWAAESDDGSSTEDSGVASTTTSSAAAPTSTTTAG